ncbi:MAG: hypothetical protein ACQSGP_09445, partial [Frankia sp.]
MPTGAYVGLGLAAAVGAAALTGRRLRRRTRRFPLPPGTAVPTDPPTPPTVTRLRRHLARHPATRPDADDIPAGTPGPPARRPAPLPPPIPTLGPPTSGPLTSDPGRAEPPLSEPPLSGPVRWGPDGAMPLDVGTDDGRTLRWDLARQGGVGLEGPGAPGAVRALLVGFLADQHQRRPRSVNELVVTQAAAGRLGLPVDTLAAIPEVRVVPDTARGVDLLEAEVLHRAWMLADAEASDIDAVRAAWPEEPLPSFLFVADTVDPRLAPRLAGVLEQGRRLDLAAVVLGPLPTGVGVTVAADGTLPRTDPGAGGDL